MLCAQYLQLVMWQVPSKSVSIYQTALPGAMQLLNRVTCPGFPVPNPSYSDISIDWCLMASWFIWIPTAWLLVPALVGLQPNAWFSKKRDVGFLVDAFC